MSNVRVKKRTNPYLIIDKSCLQDKRLSFKAKGLHAYLLSLPDDFTICVSMIIKQSTDGRRSVYSALDELIDARYVTREQTRKKTGFGAYDYTVYEIPVRDENVHAHFVHAQNVQLINNNSNNKEYIKKEKENNIKEKEMLADFNEFFSEYPERAGDKSKKKAERLYISQRKSGVSRDDLLKAARNYKVECDRLNKINTEYVKMCSTFLSKSDRHFEEYINIEAQTEQRQEADLGQLYLKLEEANATKEQLAEYDAAARKNNFNNYDEAYALYQKLQRELKDD